VDELLAKVLNVLRGEKEIGGLWILIQGGDGHEFGREVLEWNLDWLGQGGDVEGQPVGAEKRGNDLRQRNSVNESVK